MEIHIGRIIKHEMQKQNVSAATLAKRINESRSAVYAIFQRPGIDSDLLIRIGSALGVNFFEHYVAARSAKPVRKKKAANMIKSVSNKQLLAEVKLVQFQNEVLYGELMTLKELLAVSKRKP